MDNQVVEIGEYDHFHPGGIFTLKKNYGRDISKFFIGAYKLVNDDKDLTKSDPFWNHSAGAVTQVNSMFVASLEGQKSRFPTLCSVANHWTVSKIAKCFELKTEKDYRPPEWRHWYNDVDMIGRHFLLYTDENKIHKRQYTICNMIVPPVY